MKISIIHNMARSGGTLICKCLACMDNIVMLSEVHPSVLSDPFNPAKQAQEWYHLLNNQDITILNMNKAATWLQLINLILRRVHCQNKYLLLRDWSHIDYTGVPWTNPSYSPTISNVLSKYFDISRYYTVRHPIDQWLSLSKLAVMQDHLNIEMYLRGYFHFAKEAYKVGFIKYEDFTHEPQKATKILAQNLSIPYDKTFIDKWYSYKNITGDTVSEGSKAAGRRTTSQEIRPLKRKPIDDMVLKQFSSNSDYINSIKLLGYND